MLWKNLIDRRLTLYVFKVKMKVFGRLDGNLHPWSCLLNVLYNGILGEIKGWDISNCIE